MPNAEIDFNPTVSSMNARLISVAAFVLAAVVFLYIGMADAPRNNTYIVLGIVFGILALVRYRRSRIP